jgi:Protein kinase domain
VDKRYELFCLKDRLFYDILDGNDSPDFKIAQQPLAEGWRQIPQGEWLVYLPSENHTPLQGWKIHISARRENAEDVLSIVHEYCIPNGISFKHLHGPGALLMRNAKYASRGASGKLVTIYPPADGLERILTDLAPLLAGQEGPYILSDLRIGDGPMYVRYGGFAERHCEDDDGRLVTAIEDNTGRLVPDRRTPVFTVPDWIDLPDCLAPHLAARNAVTTTGLPYEIKEALHFSNGGGVYQGVDTRTGEKVVLKEGRPHAGLAGDGADAVVRLRREHATLERLAGIDGVPAARDYFVLGEHHFLVEELIEGKPLNSFFALRHPLLGPEADPAQIADYTAWALKIYEGTERVVTAVHERGIVFNDLHMFNIMVRPDDTVALIDFEVAEPAVDEKRQSMANPGFLAPADRRGVAVDRYSLACLRLALFMPMTTLFVLDREKARHLAELIAERFPVPQEFLDSAVAEITAGSDRAADHGARGGPSVHLPPRLAPEPLGWEQARTALSSAILASATLGRDDRLFPGDVEQFSGGRLGLAHGAAGVLYALDVTGCPVQGDHENWFVEHATDPPAGSGLGLYDGLHGAAYTLAHLGHHDAALKVAEMVRGERWQQLGTGLYDGLAGIALNLDLLAELTGESALADEAGLAVQIVADRVADGEGAPSLPGLMSGMSGPALMFIRRYERTGEPALLDHAARALGRDLDACVTDRAGGTQVDQGWRTMPYLATGSVGIGMVIDDFLQYRDDERLREARATIRTAARSLYYAQSGLFNGRAGMLVHVARQERTLPRTSPYPVHPDVATHVRDLAWHAVPYEGGLAFPGDQLLRLSMDLATGTAGVLLSLGTALHDTPACLPFLGPLRSQVDRRDPTPSLPRDPSRVSVQHQ